MTFTSVVYAVQVVHSDMKSRNVLLNSAMHAKISDVSLFDIMPFLLMTARETLRFCNCANHTSAATRLEVKAFGTLSQGDQLLITFCNR
jgi:hypothetical protein